MVPAHGMLKPNRLCHSVRTLLHSSLALSFVLSTFKQQSRQQQFSGTPKPAQGVAYTIPWAPSTLHGPRPHHPISGTSKANPTKHKLHHHHSQHTLQHSIPPICTFFFNFSQSSNPSCWVTLQLHSTRFATQHRQHREASSHSTNETLSCITHPWASPSLLDITDHRRRGSPSTLHNIWRVSWLG